MIRALCCSAVALALATKCVGQFPRIFNTTYHDERMIASWCGYAWAKVQNNSDIKPNPPPTFTVSDKKKWSASAQMPPASVSVTGPTPPYQGASAPTAGAGAGGNASATCLGPDGGIGTSFSLSALANSSGNTNLTVPAGVYAMPTSAAAVTDLIGRGAASLAIWMVDANGIFSNPLGGAFVYSPAQLTVGGSAAKTLTADGTMPVTPAAATIDSGPGNAQLWNNLRDPFTGRDPDNGMPIGITAPWTVLSVTGKRRIGSTVVNTSSPRNYVWPGAARSVQVTFVEWLLPAQLTAGAFGNTPNYTLAVFAGAKATQSWSNSSPNPASSGSTNGTANASVVTNLAISISQFEDFPLGDGFEDPEATGRRWIW